MKKTTAMPRHLVCAGAVAVAPVACGSEMVNAPLPADPSSSGTQRLPENSGIVRSPAVHPPCFTKLSKTAQSPPLPGQPMDWEKSMTPPRLVSGTDVPDVPVGDLPFSWDMEITAVHVLARCVIRKEGNVSDCDFICSCPKVDKRILEMLSEQRYSPILRQGAPVDVRYTFRYHFNVD